MNAPTEWLITTAGQGAAGLLVWSWQALALLALAWLTLKICRMKSPALRHQVWLFGLVAVATLPLLSLAIQRFPSLLPASPALNYAVEAPQVVIDLASQPPAQTLPEIAPEQIATALSVIFFFHPLVRYACRQLSLEREMACDDRVVAAGVAAEVYAAGVLKAAERSVIAVGSPSGAHQLALSSTGQILERRLEMILNTNRARMIAHQWRYLVLPIAMIAVAGFLLIPRYSAKDSSSNSPAIDSPKPAKDSPVKVTYSAQEQELIDMIQQVAEAIPQQWHYRYHRAGLPDGRLVLDDLRVYDRQSPLIILLPKPPQIPVGVAPGYSISKVEVGAFDVSVNDDSAVIDFIGTLHLSVPGQDKETLVTDPYRVNLVKVNDQWQADRQNMPRGVGPMFWPPRPPAPPFETHGAHFERSRHIDAMTLHNFGDAQFLVQSSLPFEGPQSVEMKLDEKELEWCGCKAWELQNAVVKLAELELRAEKGSRTLGPHVDAVYLKDRFEFQWGKQIYYGLGDITAGYHLQNKRLGLGSSPETKLYRTPDRTGEAITLQQLAQELKYQSLRKN